jgi:hypothetical protein
MKIFRVEDEAQWWSNCLAFMRPCVQSSVWWGKKSDGNRVLKNKLF